MQGYGQDVQEVLSQFGRMSESVTVYIPTTINVNQAVDTTEWVHIVSRELSELFGGATITQGSGCWVSDTEGLVEEKVIMVKSYCVQLTGELVQKVIELCQKMKITLSQEAISLEVNNSLILI